MTLPYLSACDITGSSSIAKLPAAQMVPGFYLKPHNLQPHFEVIESMYGAAALSGRTATAWQTRLDWVQESINFRGFQLSVPWGLYETGVSGGDFSNLLMLKDVVDDLGVKGKYAMLMAFQFREFRNPDVSTLGVDNQMRYLLPEDMRTHQGVVNTIQVLASQGITPLTTTGKPSNATGSNGQFAYDYATDTLYGPKAGGVWPNGAVDPMRQNLWDYAYGYQKGQNSNFGFELKIYDSYVQSRLMMFAEAVADTFNSNSAVVAITTHESANAGPMYRGTAAGSVDADGYDATASLVDTPTNPRRAGLAGKSAVLQAARPLFPNKIFMQDINVPLNGYNYVAEYFGYVLEHKMGATTSDVGWWEPDLNILGPEPTRGCLPRMADYSDRIPICGQLQQDGYDSTTHDAPAITSTAEYEERYADLFARLTTGNATVGFGMGCHMCIIQLETQYNIWLGGTTQNTNAGASGYNPDAPNGTTIPSFKTWLKNKFAAEGITDGSGGLSKTSTLFIGNS